MSDAVWREDKERRGYTFASQAAAYTAKTVKEGKAGATLTKTEWLIGMANANFGNKPITDITAPMILRCLRKVEAKGNYETAKRLRAKIGAVFRYAVANGTALTDPTYALRDALIRPMVTPRAAITDAKALEHVAGCLIRDSQFERFVIPLSCQIWGIGMGKPHPIELRSRVIAFVEEGHGHREAARHFRVSPRFVNDMVILKRASGALLPKPQGNHAEGKLAPFSGWLRERLAVKGDLTLDEIVVEMASVHGVTVHRGSVGRWLHRLGLSHKKTLLASEILRPEVAERRRVWVETFQPDTANMLERLVFIDETSLKSNLVKTTGWAPVGQRLVDHAPFGHWHTPHRAPPVRR